MKHVYARALCDEELRTHLERGDTITFTDAVKDWQDIERQVERLGFGDSYAVSRGNRPDPAGRQSHTSVPSLTCLILLSARFIVSGKCHASPRNSH